MELSFPLVLLCLGFGAAAAEYARLCSELGPGTHELSGGANIVCPSN